MAKNLVGSTRYELTSKLGSGAFGVVYVVRDKGDNAEYVMKKIQVGSLKPDETFDALREAKLLYQLSHPNIVRYRDSFMESDCFCIITEYCRGGDLHQRIQATKKAGKRLHEDDVVDWFTQLTMAIHYMHERRILHRDLKSSNVFLTHDSIVKLGDLGIAKVLMGTVDSASTFTGTPYYMSPEVLKNEAYNSKSDIWSMGCILYELCCLERPFEGRSLIGLMFKICEEPSPTVGDDYSDDVRDLVSYMLEKDPAKRPSATEILTMASIRSRMGSTLERQNTLDLKRHRQQIAANCAKGTKPAAAKDDKPLTPAELVRLRKLQRADQEAARLAEEAKRAAAEGQQVAKQRMQEQMKHSPYRYDDRPGRPKSAGPTPAKNQLVVAAEKERPSSGVSRLKGALMADAERTGDLSGSFSSLRVAEQTSGTAYSVSGALSISTVEKERPLPTSSKNSKAREARRAKMAAAQSKQDTVESGSDEDDLVLSVTGQGIRAAANAKPKAAAQKGASKAPLTGSTFGSSVASGRDIPSDGEAAESYYGTDRFEVISSDDDSGVLDASDATGGDRDEMIACMNKVLQTNFTKEEKSRVVEDSNSFVPTNDILRQRHEALKADAIKQLGADAYEQVYKYLRQARSSAKVVKESEIVARLAEIAGKKKVDACFIVEQLVMSEILSAGKK